MAIRPRLLAAVGAVALSVSLLPTLPSIGKQTPWDAHILAGQDALRTGNYIEARRQLDDALVDTRSFQSKDPRLGETYFCLGELNLNEQNYGQAKQYYQRALELQQQTPGIDQLKLADTLYGLATASEMTGDREMAVILLKRVRDIWMKQYGVSDRRLLKVLKPMGIYATVSGDFPTAEQCYRQLVSLEESTAGSSSPQVGSALNLLSLILTRTGKYSESETVANRAVQLLASAPDYRSLYEQALDNLSFIDHQLGKPGPQVEGQPDTPQAVPSTPPKTSIAAAPATPPKTNIATAPATTKPASQLTAPGKQTIAMTTTTVTPKTMSPILETTSDKFEYKTQPRGSSIAPPTPPQPLSGSVQTQVVLRPPTTSVQSDSSEFRPWEVPGTGKNAGTQPARINWGTITYLAGGKLITPEQYQAMLLANEAYELIRQEKYKMACDILYRALGICPELASVHTNLGLALSQVGNKPEAIDHLKQAISIDPKKSAPWINLASAFQIDGQLKASIATYSEFVRRFPNHPLTPKAKEIVAHLGKELKEQQAVEVALGNKSQNSLADYLAYARHPGEMRWPNDKTTLHVYIQKGDSVPGYRTEYDGFTQAAFREWASASGGKVAFEFTKHPDNADIDWRWTNQFNEVSSVAEGGEAKVDANGKEIKHATVTVLTVNPSIDTPLSANQVRTVCLHEIGHALGLIGHSPNPDDVMYCSMPPASARPALSSRDVGTIKKLYDQTVALLLRALGALKIG